MSRMDYSAYIFDLDGTLFEIPVDWPSVRDEVAQTMGEPMGNSSLFTKVGQVLELKPELRSRLFGIIDSHELDSIEQATPTVGAIELVSRLAVRARLALVTMQGVAACSRLLKKHGVSDLFEPILTREDSLDRASQLATALSNLNVSVNKVLFVGDKLNDVLSAVNVGVDVAVVGKHAKPEWKADYTFSSLADLASRLDRV